MRIPLTILAAALVAAGCFAAASLLPDPLEAQEAPPEGRAGPIADVDDLRKDLEVMRRLLSRAALGTSATDRQRVVWYYTGTNGGATGGSEALYVAGAGPLFILRAAMPVAPGPGADPETSDEPTAWDKVVAEVEGRPTPGARSGQQPVYEAERVAKLEADVLETLARFGANLDQVPRGEFITVIVTGRGGGTLPPAGKALYSVTPTGVVVDDEGKPFEIARMAFDALSGRSVQSAHETVLTIRVSMADCRAAQQGGAAADELRRRARINRY